MASTTSYGTMEDIEHPEPKETQLEKASPYVAEFVGTFMLTFTMGVCCVAGDAMWNCTAVAAILMVMIYGLGPVSGGHFNPSVSVSCALAGKTSWPVVAGYIAAQVVGGLFAGWVYWITLGQAAAVGPKATFGSFHAGFSELFYTAMIAFAHLCCATSPRNNPKDDQNSFFGLAIGFVVVAAGYATGDVSGALINPAITLGLDVTGAGGTGREGLWWRLAYLAYQFLGAGLATLLFHLCRFREVENVAGGPGAKSLQVQILSATNLANRDSGILGDVSDPYVTVRVGIKEFRTPTISNNLNPVWSTGNTFTFSLPEEGEPGHLSLEVLNDNVVIREQSLGTLSVDLRNVSHNEWRRDRDTLLGGKGAELQYALRINSGVNLGGRKPSLPSKVASEFIGTFALCLTVGLNVVMKSPATPWSAAAALMSMVYSLGSVSGGHFNPAVTLGAVLSGRGVCPLWHGMFYWSVQLLAGVLAGLLVSDFHQEGPYKFESFDLVPGKSVQVAGSTYSWWCILAAEGAFTFMLAFVVLAVATTKPAPGPSNQNFQFGLAIGSCLTAGGFAIGAVSGGELNPAVSFGIATASAATTTIDIHAPWSYCLAFSAFELLGGFVAAIVFRLTHPAEFGAKE
uniref:C2 domain-containing protein n=1 Tax=Alexandrium monilatum TaxID=311494 RepID=A0A7S4S8K4_9DINO